MRSLQLPDCPVIRQWAMYPTAIRVQCPLGLSDGDAKELGKRERQVETVGSRAGAGQTDPEGPCGGKLLSPELRRCAVEHARAFRQTKAAQMAAS